MEPYANVDNLLEELYAKKKWLDEVIEALETAVQSPHHQFIQTVGQTFDDLSGDSPKVDLQPSLRSQLADLANDIRRVRRRGGPRGSRSRIIPIREQRLA